MRAAACPEPPMNLGNMAALSLSAGAGVPQGRNCFGEGTALKLRARGWADGNMRQEVHLLWALGHHTHLEVGHLPALFIQELVALVRNDIFFNSWWIWIAERLELTWKLQLLQQLLKKHEWFRGPLDFILFHERCNSQKCDCGVCLNVRVLFLSIFFFFLTCATPSLVRNLRGQWGKRIQTESKGANESDQKCRSKLSLMANCDLCHNPPKKRGGRKGGDGT